MNADDTLTPLQRYRRDLWKALGERFTVEPIRQHSAEVYLSGFATVCVSVGENERVAVERYYDSELVNDRLGAHREYADLPPIAEVVTLAHQWLKSIRGDESIFGGIE